MIVINEMVMISTRRLIDIGDDRSSPLICRFQKRVPAMDFLNNINAVLHLSDPDQVPFAPYNECFPSGEFERALRNRGLGLVVRRPTIWPSTPRVSVEKRTEGVPSLRSPYGDFAGQAFGTFYLARVLYFTHINL